MNISQIQRLDNLTLEIESNLAILNSAVKANDGLEVCELEDFVSQIYQNSQKIRKIFDDEIVY